MSISENMTNYLIHLGRLWIERQRNQYHPRGTPIPSEARQYLSPFFLRDTLDAVRVVRVPLIENPAFYGTVLSSRLPRLIDFRKASGITFIDTVLLSDRYIVEAPSLSLLFHETVHVVQYSFLGVEEFARRYVLGWAKGGYRYGSIPLEEQASRLTAAFEAGLIKKRVEEEVERTMPP